VPLRQSTQFARSRLSFTIRSLPLRQQPNGIILERQLRSGTLIDTETLPLKPQEWARYIGAGLSFLAAGGLLSFGAEKIWDHYFAETPIIATRAGLFVNDLDGNHVYVVRIANNGLKSMSNLTLEANFNGLKQPADREVFVFPDGVNMILDDITTTWSNDDTLTAFIKEIRPGTGFTIGVTSRSYLKFIDVQIIGPDYALRKTF